MQNAVLFQEKQKFSRWWIYPLLIPANLLILIVFFKQVILGEIVDARPMSSTGITILALVVFLFSLAMITAQLETKIRQDGIFVRFFPFHRSFRYYKWSELDRFAVRQYRPMAEYGGWGLRAGFGKGVAYNVSGNMGLQLIFKDGKPLLIGTQKPEELTEALHQIGEPVHAG